MRAVSLSVRLTDVDELLRRGSAHGVRGWLDQPDPDRTALLRAALLRRWPTEVQMTWQELRAVGRHACTIACTHAHV